MYFVVKADFPQIGVFVKCRGGETGLFLEAGMFKVGGVVESSIIELTVAEETSAFEGCVGLEPNLTKSSFLVKYTVPEMNLSLKNSTCKIGIVKKLALMKADCARKKDSSKVIVFRIVFSEHGSLEIPVLL